MNIDTLTYLTDWLVGIIKPDFDASEIVSNPNTGTTRRGLKYYVTQEGFSNIKKGNVSQLWALFDKHVCEGKEKRLRIAQGELYVFNGKWFEKVDGSAFLKELVRKVLIALGVSTTYQLYASAIIAKELLGHISYTPDCQYKPDRRYICFENCIFDTKDGSIKPHNIRYCTDITLNFNYDERASFLLWDIKLKEIIPNKDFRKAFQQFCGSLLAKRSELKIEYICYLYGTGSNGKSVLASSVANVFGERYYSTFTPQMLFKTSDAMFNMKELQGKILNVCDDLTATDFSGGAFKRFISGEPQTGRSPYSKEFVKIQPPMLICCTNHLPDNVSDDSYGHHRRQLPIFTTRQQFNGEKRDPELTAKLCTDEARARIFNWIYEGFKSLRAKKGNIELGEAVQEAMEVLKADSSPMRRWAMERGLTYAKSDGKEDKRWRLLKDWFADFEQFCVENGYPKTGNSRALASMFRDMGFESDRWVAGTAFCIGIAKFNTDKEGNYISPADRETEDINE